jgi:hypothetical protein
MMLTVIGILEFVGRRRLSDERRSSGAGQG